MEDFVAQVLEKLNGDLSRFGEAFEAKLSHHDELMLVKIDEEITIRVEGILDLVLAGTPINGEIALHQRQREHVMHLMAIRRAIHRLISERGSLQATVAGLN